MPRQKREVLFGRGELSRAALNALRDIGGPMMSRQIAQAIVAVSGQDARDRKFVSDLTRRVSKALRQRKADGTVRQGTDAKGNVMWWVMSAVR
jgi:hypothetical protein